MASLRALGRVSSLYRGPVKAAIFDWAGTIVDHGSLAPVRAFVELFAHEGVELDTATARGPMGRNKRDHIADVLAAPHIDAAWRAKYRGLPSDHIDRLYAKFTPLQVEVARKRAIPIRGVVDALAKLKDSGVKIGSCSGYNDAIMAAVAKGAKVHGLSIDVIEVANAAGTNGRPKPWLSTRVAERLDVFPLCACVKVDDTLPGIAEGLNAGMWTVGVTRTGNEVGLDEHEVAALPAAELEARLAAARRRFEGAGAHYVVESVVDLPAVVEDINARMAAGETPLA